MRSLRLAGAILVGALLAAPIALLRRRGRGQRIVRWWMRRVARILRLEIVVHGKPAPGPALWCANHVSWLDVVALGALADVTFVAKSEVRDWPLLGWCARSAGTLFVRRGAAGCAISAMTERLRAADTLAIFPEGTTGRGERPSRFHARLFAAARAAGTPIQPVALRFSEAGRLSGTAPFVGEDAFLPHLLRILAGGALRVDVAFAPPIAACGLDRRGLAQAAHGAVIRALAGLPPVAPARAEATGDRPGPVAHEIRSG